MPRARGQLRNVFCTTNYSKKLPAHFEIAYASTGSRIEDAICESDLYTAADVDVVALRSVADALAQRDPCRAQTAVFYGSQSPAQSRKMRAAC
jgi:hypothetical protein